MVEGAALEKRYTFTGIVGSNPTLSAIYVSAQGGFDVCTHIPSHVRREMWWERRMLVDAK